jgi:hypothetical protein
LSGTALPETAENRCLGEAPAQTPHRETGSRRAQIRIEVGEAYELRAIGREARDPAAAEPATCGFNLDFEAVFSENLR